MQKEMSVEKLKKENVVAAKSRLKQWLKNLESDLGTAVESDIGAFVYLLMDCSISMEGTKLVQAKEGALNFAAEAGSKGYLIGLIQFASSATHLYKPQKEIAFMRPYVEKMRADGSTNMAEGIHMATDRLSDKTGYRVVVIVTDGMPDDPKAALEAAELAKGNKIEIITIGTDDADKEFLKKLASQNELAIKVSKHQLEQGIVSSAKMLPAKTRRVSND